MQALQDGQCLNGDAGHHLLVHALVLGVPHVPQAGAQDVHDLAPAISSEHGCLGQTGCGRSGKLLPGGAFQRVSLYSLHVLEPLTGCPAADSTSVVLALQEDLQQGC